VAPDGSCEGAVDHRPRAIAPEDRSGPGIEDVEVFEALEVLEVSGDDGHVVDQCGSADEGIAEWRGIWDVQGSGATRNFVVDRNHSILECCGHALVEPLTKQRSLCGIGALDGGPHQITKYPPA